MPGATRSAASAFGCVPTIQASICCLPRTGNDEEPAIGPIGIRLNVDASKGTARVQLLDANNKPIPGFGFADCSPITTDVLSALVQWKRPVAELRGTPLKLEIALENSSLFAIAVTSGVGMGVAP